MVIKEAASNSLARRTGRFPQLRTADGAIEKWLIGGPAINRMEAKGWYKTTVKPGDTITGIGYQFADGQKIVKLEWVVLPDGKELLLYAGG